jgi:fibronectin-binding autotransporter adhesin
MKKNLPQRRMSIAFLQALKSISRRNPMKTSPLPVRIVALLAMGILASESGSAAPVIWNGPGAGANNWSTAGNWQGGVAPDASGDVKFYDDGAVTPGTVNNVVDTGFTSSILSLQYGQTNGSFTTLVSPGVTLNVSGNVLAGNETITNITVTNKITGAGAALVVNNSGSSFIVRQAGTAGAANRGTLDLSGLDTFTATISKLLVGVGTGGSAQNRATGRLILARTNTITASGNSPAIDIGHSGSNNGNGSTVVLGQTNAVFANSMVVGSAKETGNTLQFNSAFPGSSAYFRAADGSSRITSWSIGDGLTGSGTLSTRGTIDFSLGSVDAQVDTVTIGKAGSNTGATAAQTAAGVLTLGAGILDINTLQIGINTAANTNWGNGTVTVNASGLLQVNTVLELGRSSSPAISGADNTRGILSINGGTVWANRIVANFPSTNNTLTINSGNLVVTNTAGPGINTFAITNSSIQVPLFTASPAIIVTNMTVGGTNNIIIIPDVPVVVGYPTKFPLIKYTGALTGTFNLSVMLPSGYFGYISNSVPSSSIDVVVTNGPMVARLITWNGSPSGDWDVGLTSDWLSGGSAVYNQEDFVLFNDTASGTTTVNLAATLTPSSITVSNNTKTYTFGGFGNLSGAIPLVKQGSGLLVIDNSGINDFSGGLVINNGTVQIGNADSAGSIGTGPVNNNGSLIFNRNDPVTIVNTIGGAGSLSQNGPGGALTLSGANTFTGAVSVVQGTLVAGNASALGTTNGPTIVSSGATLDLNALNLGAEPVIVQGQGVNLSGAIVNGAIPNQLNALRYVTLANDTTFGGIGRWDIRSPSSDPAGADLNTGGSPYNLTKVGPSQQISLVAVTVDSALGDIEVKEGTFSVETSTTGLGNPSKTLTVQPGATFQVWSLTNQLNKNIILNGDGFNPSINAGSGPSTIIGLVTLNNNCVINVPGTSLNLNNMTGAGSLVKLGTGALIISGADTHSGGTTIGAGTLLINGTMGGTVTVNSGATLGGNGNSTGVVDVQGAFNPGPINGAGTFTSSGSLTIEGSSTMTFDLGAVTTVGSGSNDLLVVNGDLTANNPTVSVNILAGRLQPGTYRLISYTGNLIGGFNPTVTTVSPTRYTFTLDTTSTAGQVNLIVSGTPANLSWNSASDTTWDVAGTPNWLNISSSVNDVFYAGDTVLLNDQPGVTNGITLAAGVAVSPFAITNNSSVNNFTVSGAGKITGDTGILKDGASMLTINTTNDFTGTVNIKGGTLKTGSSAALGTTAGGTVITNGGTLDVGGQTLGAEAITVSGAGVGGKGAIINSGASITTALRNVTMAGDTVFGGAGPWSSATDTNRWDIRAGGTPSVATLSTSGNAYKLTKTGSNHIALVSVTIDPMLADIDLQQGLLTFEVNTTSMGNPANSLTVRAGATLGLYNATSLFDKVFILNGDGVTATITNWSGSNTLIGPITLNGSTVFGIGGTALAITAPITGSGNLTKTVTSPLNLYAANTYTGDTTISAGTLALVGAGSIASSPTITLSSGTTLDVKQRSDATLTLSSGQTLKGNGTVSGHLVVNSGAVVTPGNAIGILTVASNVTLTGTITMNVDRTANTNSQLRSTSGVINYGGQLNIVNLTAALAAGNSFKLFNASAYTNSFSSIVPATPGPGLAWDTSSLNSNGTLKVISSTSPSIGTVGVSGGNFVFSGSGGVDGNTYYVLTSTDVSLPLNQWTRIATNTFGAGGNFSFTAGPTSGSPSKFYVIQLQ